ncbi:hypothetical protein [Alicyclobacillus mali (ex Roth et al. 2021)]|uniref:hypothetical protein n=1 Tax=Alicyclobacillus mali (ex Roth et al. 2021) TaxID=1123961 RepID=UPI000AD859B1|nr:hypothetical protein [Alicyclobacillus mali (ex Roth et al. 2021)]
MKRVLGLAPILCTGLLTACGAPPQAHVVLPRQQVSLRMAVIQDVPPSPDANPLLDILHSVQWQLSDGSKSYSEPRDVVRQIRMQNIEILQIQIPRIATTEGVLVAGQKNGTWKTDALFLLPSPKSQNRALDGGSLSKAETTGAASVPNVGDVNIFASADEMVCFLMSNQALSLANSSSKKSVRLASGVQAKLSSAAGVNSLSYPYGSRTFFVVGNVASSQLVSVANNYTPNRVFFSLEGHQGDGHVSVGT